MANQRLGQITSIGELQRLGTPPAVIPSAIPTVLQQQLRQRRGFLTSDLGVSSATAPVSQATIPGIANTRPGSEQRGVTDPSVAPKTGEPIANIRSDVARLSTEFQEALNLANDPSSSLSFETASNLADRMKKRLSDALPEKFKPSANIQKGGTGTQQEAQQGAAENRLNFENAPNVDQGGGFSEGFMNLMTNPQFQLLLGNIGSALGSPLGAAVSDSAKSRIASEITRGQQEGLQDARTRGLDLEERRLKGTEENRRVTQAASAQRDERITQGAAVTQRLAQEAGARSERSLGLQEGRAEASKTTFADIVIEAGEFGNATARALAPSDATPDEVSAIAREARMRIYKARGFSLKDIEQAEGSATAPATGGTLDFNQFRNTQR